MQWLQLFSQVGSAWLFKTYFFVEMSWEKIAWMIDGFSNICDCCNDHGFSAKRVLLDSSASKVLLKCVKMTWDEIVWLLRFYKNSCFRFEVSFIRIFFSAYPAWGNKFRTKHQFMFSSEANSDKCKKVNLQISIDKISLGFFWISFVKKSHKNLPVTTIIRIAPIGNVLWKRKLKKLINDLITYS